MKSLAVRYGFWKKVVYNNLDQSDIGINWVSCITFLLHPLRKSFTTYFPFALGIGFPLESCGYTLLDNILRIRQKIFRLQQLVVITFGNPRSSMLKATHILATTEQSVIASWAKSNDVFTLPALVTVVGLDRFQQSSFRFWRSDR